MLRRKPEDLEPAADALKAPVPGPPSSAAFGGAISVACSAIPFTFSFHPDLWARPVCPTNRASAPAFYGRSRYPRSPAKGPYEPTLLTRALPRDPSFRTSVFVPCRPFPDMGYWLRNGRPIRALPSSSKIEPYKFSNSAARALTAGIAGLKSDSSDRNNRNRAFFRKDK